MIAFKIIKLISVLKSCHNPAQIKTWQKWIERLQIPADQKIMILSFAEKYIKDLKNERPTDENRFNH